MLIIRLLLNRVRLSRLKSVGASAGRQHLPSRHKRKLPILIGLVADWLSLKNYSISQNPKNRLTKLYNYLL
jgi:hypothetical protein